MARTELPNGVILPAEYSDDWYEDMTSNLTKLDDVIGSDSEKLNSNDVAFLRMSSAALTDGGTGNFSDLNSSNKLKTGDYVLDSGRKLYQVVSVDSTNETFTVGNSLFKITAESDLAPVAESGDYDDLDNKPDLNPYDQHIVNTDIHVTTADKNKWNNQTYVFRYSSTALVASSTNSNTLLDNTDNLKVGDKVIDSSGVLFSITAIDSVNSTFTVGSALVDLALDANVVHTSGNETVGGNKTFSDNLSIYNSDNSVDTPVLNIKTSKYVKGDTTNTDTMRINFLDSNDNNVASVYANKNIGGSQYLAFQIYTTDNNNANITSTINYYISKSGDKSFVPYEDGQISLGGSVRRWKSIYATNYYYGRDNVEFSTKFVTSDTNQTITGTKTFSDSLTIYNSDDTQTPKGLTIRNAQWGMGESGGITVSNINFLDKNSSIPASVMASKGLYGQSFLRFNVRTKDSQNNTYSEEIYYDIDTSGNVEFRSWHDNIISLGTSAYKWKDVQTNLVNGLTPSSLSMPDFANRVNIAGYISNLSGSTNNYTPPVNGWLYVGSNDASYLALFDTGSGGCGIRFSDGVVGEKYACIPCQENRQVGVKITCTNLAHAYFVPCQGNV